MKFVVRINASASRFLYVHNTSFISKNFTGNQIYSCNGHDFGWSTFLSGWSWSDLGNKYRSSSSEHHYGF